MPGDIDNDEGRETAERIEREHPNWIVVFGVYTRQFVCFPRFHAPPGTVLVALYPVALHTRMQEAERLLQLPRNLRTPRIGQTMIRKTRLEGEPRKVREQIEALAHALAPPYESSSGERLRALAQELAGREHLEIYVVSYEDGAQELEIAHTGDPSRNPVTIAHDNTGNQCQITFEKWTAIGDETGLTKAADTIAAILAYNASAHRNHEPPINSTKRN